MRGQKDNLEIFILATNACNLACSYCYETGKNSRTMDIERIWPRLKARIEQAGEAFAHIAVIFHGGEPLLAFEPMRALCERIWALRADVVCQMTTNGTLLSDEHRRWLVDNRHRFVPILSIDGAREAHNRNRSNSYERIDRDFFRTNFPHAEVKMTVAPNTLGELFDNFKALREAGFRVNPGLANEVAWELDRDLPIYARELNKLVGYYLAHPNERPCKLLDMQIEQLAPNLTLESSKGCGAGVNIVAFDVDGNAYPCHSFIADLSQPYDRAQMEHLATRLAGESGDKLIAQCAACPIYRCCSPCFGLNHAVRGALDALDVSMCALMKVGVLAAAKLYACMLVEPQRYVVLKERPQEDLYNIAAAVRFVFDRVEV